MIDTSKNVRCYGWDVNTGAVSRLSDTDTLEDGCPVHQGYPPPGWTQEGRWWFFVGFPPPWIATDKVVEWMEAHGRATATSELLVLLEKKPKPAPSAYYF